MLYPGGDVLLCLVPEQRFALGIRLRVRGVERPLLLNIAAYPFRVLFNNSVYLADGQVHGRADHKLCAVIDLQGGAFAPRAYECVIHGQL